MYLVQINLKRKTSILCTSVDGIFLEANAASCMLTHLPPVVCDYCDSDGIRIGTR